MKKILLTLLILPNLAYAQYIKEHQTQKQQLFANLDYCSNIANNEIFKLGSQEISFIKQNLETIKSNFTSFGQQKADCFNASTNFLNEIIANNMVFLESNNNINFELQNKIDLKLLETIDLRKKINLQLLQSIISDLESSINSNSDFITESKETANLMSQELNLIYKSMQEQLTFDEEQLNEKQNPTLIQVANISIRSAFLEFSEALLLFENIEKGPKAYTLAKIRTHIQNAQSKLLELKAFSKSLDKLDCKTQINQILNKITILNVDLEGAINDLTTDSFAENYLDWAGLVYQQTSKIVDELNKVLDTIYLETITN